VEANPLKVDNYCYKFVFDGGDSRIGMMWVKNLECHPKDYSRKRSYFLFEPFVRQHPVFTFNLAMENNIYARATPQEAKKGGYEVYDEYFKPTKEDFLRFKQHYGIKE
jgi:hypothetical protein